MEKSRLWTLNVEEDPETGDSMLTFPPDLLESTGWKEGDVLEWHNQGDGAWKLNKKNEQSAAGDS